jgi:hypothetical protein
MSSFLFRGTGRYLSTRSYGRGHTSASSEDVQLQSYGDPIVIDTGLAIILFGRGSNDGAIRRWKAPRLYIFHDALQIRVVLFLYVENCSLFKSSRPK